MNKNYIFIKLDRLRLEDGSIPWVALGYPFFESWTGKQSYPGLAHKLTYLGERITFGRIKVTDAQIGGHPVFLPYTSTIDPRAIKTAHRAMMKNMSGEDFIHPRFWKWLEKNH